MSLTVQTNIASLIAQNNLNTNSTFMTKTIERLSSGYRINSSADDAAGLVIANQFRSNVAELTQGISNANDGVSGNRTGPAVASRRKGRSRAHASGANCATAEALSRTHPRIRMMPPVGAAIGNKRRLR